MISLRIVAGSAPVAMSFRDFDGNETPQGEVPPHGVLDTAFEGCVVLRGAGEVTARALQRRLSVQVSDTDPAPIEYGIGVVAERTLAAEPLILIDLRG
jgi:hypothetical protein